MPDFKVDLVRRGETAARDGCARYLNRKTPRDLTPTAAMISGWPNQYSLRTTVELSSVQMS